ncbi:protease inhibitor I42 family protein [Streptomyces sp. BE308]|uniref:protease inhibitor I42 family protein n=1 Tax=Streptomyces sp. BE308 TaxID=3002529 RepID=UPI002E76DC27|nr:protease inhibitor I42 family protein [Streptomyces sp. BE308]MEE1792614.1 protease inhibitor I42 family protein [Streptomyces sp. BE308]
MLELGPADHGSTHTVGPGDEVLLRLPENPGTSCVWQVESLPPGLETTGGSFTRRSSAIGASGTRTLCFRALGAPQGERRLDLAERRPWEPDYPPAAVFTVTLRFTG